MDINHYQALLAEFARERDWDPFHTPKNLTTALMCEAAELAELFQWMTPEQSESAGSDPAIEESLRDEIADVQIYLLRLAQKLGVDIEKAVQSKLAKNAQKYPVDRAKGNAIKYSRRKD